MVVRSLICFNRILLVFVNWWIVNINLYTRPGLYAVTLERLSNADVISSVGIMALVL